MAKKTHKMSLIIPFDLYRKIKKESDKRTENEEKFVSQNTIVVEVLESAFKEEWSELI